MNRSSLAWAAVLGSAVLGAALCGCSNTSETIGTSGSGGSAPVSAFAAYKYRRDLKITGAIPPNYALSFPLDHASLVQAQKSLKDGSDVRVVITAAGVENEASRVLDPVSQWNTGSAVIWFRVPAGTAADATYTVYYGNDKPDPPLDNAQNVYLLWEDFRTEMGIDGSWKLQQFGTAMGKPSHAMDGLRLSGQSADFGGMTDDGVYFFRTIQGDFAADAAIVAVGGSLGGNAKMGGLMVRQSGDPDATFAMMSVQEIPRQRLSMSRGMKGMPANSAQLMLDQSCDMMGHPACFPQLVRVVRIGTSVTTQYSDDGIAWIGLGMPATVTLPDLGASVQLGIPFSNISSDVGYADTAWFRATKRVSSPPTVQLGPESANGS